MKKEKINLEASRKKIRALAENHPAICKECRIDLDDINHLEESGILKIALQVSKASKVSVSAFVILEGLF